MNEYQFVLPYPPSVNTYWRRRGSQYYISDKGQKYRKDVQQIIRQLKLDIFTKSRLRIKVIADVPDSRRRDLDNILKVYSTPLSTPDLRKTTSNSMTFA